MPPLITSTASGRSLFGGRLGGGGSETNLKSSNKNYTSSTNPATRDSAGRGEQTSPRLSGATVLVLIAYFPVALVSRGAGRS